MREIKLKVICLVVLILFLMGCAAKEEFTLLGEGEVEKIVYLKGGAWSSFACFL